jgi:hypothetical protein
MVVDTVLVFVTDKALVMGRTVGKDPQTERHPIEHCVLFQNVLWLNNRWPYNWLAHC